VNDSFETHGLTVTPVPVEHGVFQVHGYRIGDLAYIPDVSCIPDPSRSLLEGLRTLVIDAVRFRPHSTHFHVEKAIAEGRRIGAEATYLTHLNHDILHAKVDAELPAGFRLAYDGLEVEITGG